MGLGHDMGAGAHSIVVLVLGQGFGHSKGGAHSIMGFWFWVRDLDTAGDLVNSLTFFLHRCG